MPNILILIADQLSQQALGCYGNEYVQSPTVDGIAARGARFQKSYTPCPLCLPARASFWTGLLPHATGVVGNETENYHQPDRTGMQPTLGTVFRDAGYDCVHFGKTHDAGTLEGFRVVRSESVPTESHPAWPINYDTEQDVSTTRNAVDFLHGASTERPFLCVADLNNPHNICGYVGAFAGEHEDVTPPTALPPLPANFETADWADRPLPVQYMCCAHRRQAQAGPWTPENYRHYLAAYYHYVHRMDQEVDAILSALKAGGHAEDTLIAFLADHGDGMAAHRCVTKHTTFYEETTRVPFFFAGPGVRPGAIGAPLVGLIDLFPTLCDYGGLPIPPGLHGESLLPWLRGEAGPLREHVVSEWFTEWNFTAEPGRMLRTERYKYMRYIEGGGEELYDLTADPGETRTLIHDPAHAEALARHRALLKAHVEATADPFFALEPKLDGRARHHAPGYEHHRGPSIPELEGT